MNHIKIADHLLKPTDSLIINIEKIETKNTTKEFTISIEPNLKTNK